MENKLFRNSVSTILVVVMVMSAFSVFTLFGNDKAYASTEDASIRAISAEDTISPFVAADPAYNASYTLNKHSFTSVIKPNKWNPIYADGHRYSRIASLYETYYNLANNYDTSRFVEGEEFFMPASINVKGTSGLNRTFTYSLSSTSLSYKRFGVELYSNRSGKYTITSQFRKCYVHIETIGTSNYLYFYYADSKLYPKVNTFYVQTKVKLAYNKKKGKLAKSKTVQWKNPTTKYGKLPKPKAKKGKRFIGWYTKSSGGKKVTSKTRVPSKNAVTLYARYK